MIVAGRLESIDFQYQYEAFINLNRVYRVTHTHCFPYDPAGCETFCLLSVAAPWNRTGCLVCWFSSQTACSARKKCLPRSCPYSGMNLLSWISVILPPATLPASFSPLFLDCCRSFLQSLFLSVNVPATGLFGLILLFMPARSKLSGKALMGPSPSPQVPGISRKVYIVAPLVDRNELVIPIDKE